MDFEVNIVCLFRCAYYKTLPIIAVISTIIDAPATLLNSTGNTVCAMLVTRLVEGKNWLSKAFKSGEISA
jgi:pyrrolidone-carboxylate peptidase